MASNWDFSNLEPSDQSSSLANIKGVSHKMSATQHQRKFCRKEPPLLPSLARTRSLPVPVPFVAPHARLNLTPRPVFLRLLMQFEFLT
jgi:hypothetical protein